MCSILLPPRMKMMSGDDKSSFDFNCLYVLLSIQEDEDYIPFLTYQVFFSHSMSEQIL